jgi:hypothetical protein
LDCYLYTRGFRGSWESFRVATSSKSPSSLFSEFKKCNQSNLQSKNFQDFIKCISLRVSRFGSLRVYKVKN